MTHFCRGLLLQYRQVICVDVDEFLVADPDCGKSLVELVAHMPRNQTWHTNSMEIVHRTDLEPEFDPGIPKILDQRGFFRTNSWYSKPCITTDKDIVWKMDGHCTYHKIRIHKDIFLVHLKWFDRDFVLKRAQIRHDFMRDETGKVFMNAGGMWGAGMEDWAREVNSFESMPISEEPCDFEVYRNGILAVAAPVGDDGVVNYPRQTSKVLYRVPDRFVGLF